MPACAGLLVKKLLASSQWREAESALRYYATQGCEANKLLKCHHNFIDAQHPAFADQALCRWLSGQLTHYSHCLFVNRHIYKYLIFWDTDEFVIVQNKSTSLVDLLDQTFKDNPHRAGAGMFRYAYRTPCDTPVPMNARHADEWLQQFVLREQITESYRHGFEDRAWTFLANKGDKLIVRPQLVDDFYFHFLISARPGYSADAVVIPAHQAFLKHIRRHAQNDKCDNLTSSMPT